jgi:hypothetical protein
MIIALLLMSWFALAIFLLEPRLHTAAYIAVIGAFLIIFVHQHLVWHI